jgi:hypothetical protein
LKKAGAFQPGRSLAKCSHDNNEIRKLEGAKTIWNSGNQEKKTIYFKINTSKI